jgi:hypothetical protein
MSDCPKCGCNDVREAPARRGGFNWSKGRAGHAPKVRMVCNCCGQAFTAEALQSRPELDVQHQEAGVTYQTPIIGGATCPKCGYHPWKVTRTLPADNGPRIRHHKCAKCGHMGKSTE